MKKTCCLLLVLAVSLLAGPLALASGAGAIDLTQAHAYETATSLCFIGDTLYMLGAYGVYAYRDGALTTELDLSGAYPYRYNPEPPEDEAQAKAWETAISRLFTDGVTLYGLHPYTGQIFRIADGRLSAYAQLPAELLEMESGDFLRDINGAVVGGGKLYLLLGTDDMEDYEKTELVAFDFISQECESFALEGVQSVAAGPEGKLLLFIRAQESAIWQFDMASGALETALVRLEERAAPTGMACYGQTPVYYENNRVLAAESADEVLVKAYLPVTYAFASTQAACSGSGLYAYPDSNYVFLRDVSAPGEAQQTVLTMMGDVSQELLINFSMEHPDVAVVSVSTLNANALRQAAISGDAGIDLFVLSAPGTFAAMKEKGYIAPLNADAALLADAGTLYPAVREVVFDADNLVGYPISMTPQSFTVNETQWENIGLGDYPQTYEALLEKTALWLDAYADDYPDYVLCDAQQLGISGLVMQLVKAHIVRCEQAGQQVAFDTPAFRAVLEAVGERADLLAEENEQWGMPLISSYNMGFGVTYADRDRMRMVAPPAIEAGGDRPLTADLSILCVNAASGQKEAALRFVAYCAEYLPDSTRYALHPDLNEPVESKTYRERVKTLQGELAVLEAQLETAKDEKRYEIADQIAQKQSTIEYVAENKWDISPESIEIYRDVAQNLYIPYQSALLSQEAGGGDDMLRSVVAEHCGNGLQAGEIEALIADLDRVSTMIDLESE